MLFAILDEKDIRFFGHFDARKLHERTLSPDGVPAQPITRFESAFDIVFRTAVLLWWVGAFGLLSPPAWNIQDWQFQIFFVRVAWGQDFALFFYPVLGLLAAAIALSVRNFLRPHWTLPSMTLQIGLNLLGVGILIWAMRAPDLIALDVVENAPKAARAELMLP